MTLRKKDGREEIPCKLMQRDRTEDVERKGSGVQNGARRNLENIKNVIGGGHIRGAGGGNYTAGKGAKHNLMVPKEATEYFTISGKSFSKYISIELHKFVHLIKYPRFFNENSP